MYKSNIEERSRNHCCHEKAISISYSERAFVALVKLYVSLSLAHPLGDEAQRGP